MVLGDKRCREIVHDRSSLTGGLVFGHAWLTPAVITVISAE